MKFDLDLDLIRDLAAKCGEGRPELITSATPFAEWPSQTISDALGGDGYWTVKEVADRNGDLHLVIWSADIYGYGAPHFIEVRPRSGDFLDVSVL